MVSAPVGNDGPTSESGCRGLRGDWIPESRAARTCEFRTSSGIERRHESSSDDEDRGANLRRSAIQRVDTVTGTMQPSDHGANWRCTSPIEMTSP